MNTANFIYVLVMGFTTIIYGAITYFFAIKKNYSLLNGYESRSEEEKEYLQTSGYLEANGKLLIYSFWILFASFIIGLFPIPYGFEIGMALFLIILLGGLFWVQRYEVPHKRKRMQWFTGILAAAVIVFIGWISFASFNDHSFVVTDEVIEINGSYGFTLDVNEIEDVQLLDQLPEVLIKANGTNVGGVLTGKFRLEKPYGTGKLFIHNQYKTTKVLYIKTADEFVMISRATDEETIELYGEIKQTFEY